MLSVVLNTLAWTVASRSAHLGQIPPRASVRCDADRCYYGNVDANGNTDQLQVDPQPPD